MLKNLKILIKIIIKYILKILLIIIFKIVVNSFDSVYKKRFQFF